MGAAWLPLTVYHVPDMDTGTRYTACVAPVMRARGARRSEHAQNISKWRPTMSLATESRIRTREASLKRWYHGPARYYMESIHI